MDFALNQKKENPNNNNKTPKQSSKWVYKTQELVRQEYHKAHKVQVLVSQVPMVGRRGAPAPALLHHGGYFPHM